MHVVSARWDPKILFIVSRNKYEDSWTDWTWISWNDEGEEVRMLSGDVKDIPETIEALVNESLNGDKSYMERDLGGSLLDRDNILATYPSLRAEILRDVIWYIWQFDEWHEIIDYDVPMNWDEPGTLSELLDIADYNQFDLTAIMLAYSEYSKAK